MAAAIEAAAKDFITGESLQSKRLTMDNAWLLLDVGNTHTVAGLWDASGTSHHTVRLRTDPQCTADEYRALLAQVFWGRLHANVWDVADRIIFSTVVPTLNGVIRMACAAGTRQVPCLSIDCHTPRDFDLDLPQPEQLGADRLANVAGALGLVKPPFLIIDAGTATTFCLVDHRPAYVGGAIVPGLETGWRALQARAAKLFAVELVRPPSSVGNTTELQLQSGVLHGYEVLIEGMCDRLLCDASELFPRAGFQNATLIATGGCTNLLALSSRFRVEPDLTLLGLFRYGQLTE